MYDIHTHALPRNFNPELAVIALRGINQAIYQLIADGMPTSGAAAAEFHVNLEGLAYSACYFANQLDAHYRERQEAHRRACGKNHRLIFQSSRLDDSPPMKRERPAMAGRSASAQKPGAHI